MNQNDIRWEKAKSQRSHCRKCGNKIPFDAQRLKVPAKFGARDGFVFYCETCAPSILRGASGVSKVFDFSENREGRFSKPLRMIRIGDGN